jgi:site-specific DNA recombinase
MSIPVPALVDAALFDAVQEQLQENRQRARVPQRGAKYLLQGLIVCACCGYAYYGKALSPSARKYHERSYAYYRCVRPEAACDEWSASSQPCVQAVPDLSLRHW